MSASQTTPKLSSMFTDTQSKAANIVRFSGQFKAKIMSIHRKWQDYEWKTSPLKVGSCVRFITCAVLLIRYSKIYSGKHFLMDHTQDLL